MSSKLTIGIVSPYNIFRAGGVQEAIKAHAEELSQRGHQLYIIAPDVKAKPDPIDDNIILLGQSAAVAAFRTTFELAATIGNKEIDDMLTQYKFDVLHFHEPWIPMIPLQLLARSECVNIATFHAKLPESPINRSIEVAITPYTKSFFKKLDYLVAVSDVAAEYVRTLTDQPVEIIPNGIDLKRYSPEAVTAAAKPDGKKVILYIGRLEKRKGVMQLLRAYRQVRQTHNGVALVLIGDGNKRLELESYVARYDVPDVQFLGYVTDEVKRQWLKAADLFCSPALYGESFGIVLLEAMAMGKVVVAGNNSGYASVLKDRGKLSLVDPLRIPDFVHRLELLLFDEEVRQLWLEWAVDYVKQFDYPKQVDRYEAIYQRAVAKHG